jgi:hypothetical protein
VSAEPPQSHGSEASGLLAGRHRAAQTNRQVDRQASRHAGKEQAGKQSSVEAVIVSGVELRVSTELQIMLQFRQTILRRRACQRTELRMRGKPAFSHSAQRALRFREVWLKNC